MSFWNAPGTGRTSFKYQLMLMTPDGWFLDAQLICRFFAVSMTGISAGPYLSQKFNELRRF
jgi:hypothetical protein